MRFLATIMFLMIVLTTILTACGGSGQAASSGSGDGSAADGQALFTSNCSACHGPTGGGLPGLGKPLTTSEFVGSLSDEELLDFIKTGRPASDPLNTSGVLMPPKGGNASLTDEQLQAIIAYIRSIRTD
jgi:disulfide bond formation protein DsbB